MAEPAKGPVEVEVEGRRLTLTNLDKVLYPATGWTKGDVIDYYRQVAPVLLAWLDRRPVTFRRFPDGVDGSSFYEKHLPRGAPSWVKTVPVAARATAGKVDRYPAIDTLAALMWAANLAVIEFHVPMWRVGRRGEASAPDLLVLDLDPGEGTGIVECCEVACVLRDRLERDRYRPLAKTSGSKGIQVYARRPPARRRSDPSEYARRLAEELESDRKSRVVANMRKDLRRHKVLVDWSQNSTAKTTVAPYSLRAREIPGVSTPLAWAEVEAVVEGADPASLAFSPAQVLARVAGSGDRFAGLLAPRRALA